MELVPDSQLPEANQDASTDSALSAEFERCVANFEFAWHRQPYPRIEDFLPTHQDLRQRVLQELNTIDAELRQKHSAVIQKAQIAASASTSPPEQDSRRVVGSPSQELNHDETGMELLVKLGSIHARHHGGLGEVLVVDDKSLGRRIAVKQLRSKWKDSSRARTAFSREISITSQLEHPGVVPIHGLGQTGDGRPFYAMRYINGLTLKDAISEFHRNCDFYSAEFRRLLRAFIMVCNTVAFAHSRSIIHRDLKPENIMLGPFGETLVLDWGLARTIGGREEERESINPENGSPAMGDCPEASRNCPDTDHSPTLRLQQNITGMGDILGTPAYMSSEQANGRVDELCPATDVFGLGATLFAILFGRSPYESDSAHRSIELAAAARACHGIQLGRVPHSLFAICSKAMEQKPADRYHSPMELAKDIDYWLGGEPVSVFPEGWFQRLWRLAGKRRTLAWTLVGVAGSLVVTLLIASQWILHERYERRLAAETTAVHSASSQQLVEFLTKTFQTATPHSFDSMGFVGSENLPDQSTFVRMLEKGQSLIDSQPDILPISKAQLLMAMGCTYRDLGNYEKAGELLEQSLEIRTSLLGGTADQTLDCKFHLARVAYHCGEYARAEAIYRQLLNHYKDEHPQRPLVIADVEYHLAFLLQSQPFGSKSPQYDMAASEESLQLLKNVLQRRRANLPAKDRSIGLANVGIATVMFNQGKSQNEIAGYIVQAIEIFRASDQENALGHFLVQSMQAEEARRKGDFELAEALFLQMETQIRKYLGPRSPFLVVHLANKAGLYQKFDRMDSAEQAVIEAIDIVRVLPSLRSTPAVINGMIQYAEMLSAKDIQRCKLVCEEALRYANERPKENEANIHRIQGILEENSDQ